MKTYLSAAALAAVLGLAATAAFAQGPPPAVENGATLLGVATLPAKGGATLTVTTPAFANMGDIPFENTQYRGNIFPGLAWSRGPAGTKSYAIIMQDGDGPPARPFILHWTMYDIPANVTSLAPGAPPAPALPPGASYGPNIQGPNHAYMGPRTPAGPKHRYHLQVFALDTVIPTDPMLTFDGLTGAMKDHVLASGQVIGLGTVDPTAPPPPPRPAGGPGGPGGGPGGPPR